MYYDTISKQTVNNPIIFLGDSITARCEWPEMFASNKVLNRGIDADTTQGILERIDSIIAMRPEKVFIMAGCNDLNSGVSKDEIIDNYREILIEIKTGSPDTKIFVHSILPVNNDFRLANRVSNTASIPKVNEALQQLAKEQGATYINLYPLFAIEDKLDKKYTPDGTHLTWQGYLTWKNQIEKYVLK